MWLPAHEAHAIERVSASVAFSEAISLKLWQGMFAHISAPIKAAHFTEQVLEERPSTPGLPGQVLARFLIGPQGPQVLTESGSRRYQLIDGGEVREEISLTRTALSYIVTRYTKWSRFLQNFEDLVGTALVDCINIVNINTIKLEYIYRFNFT